MNKYLILTLILIFLFPLNICIYEKTSQAEEVNLVSTSLPVLLDSLKVKTVTHWGDKLCIARRFDDTYELEVYRKKSSNKFIKIYSSKIDGIYHLDGMTSDDFLIVYGSSSVATQISLLRWDKKNQKVLDFEDTRFDGDSRLRPEILTRPRGFQILTFGNINDMGNEPDESKWYANIYTFEKGILVSATRVPFSKRYSKQ